MSISIRLKKMGKRDQPFYRVVVADTLKKHEGAYLENLGWYNPLAAGDNYLLKTDRIEYWMSQGARVSDTVTSLLRRNRKRLRNAPAEPAPAEPASVEEPAATTTPA